MNGSRKQIYWRDGWDMRKSRLKRSSKVVKGAAEVVKDTSEVVKGASKVVKGVSSDGKVNKCNEWLSPILNLDRMTGKVAE
jgi:hypothetical protein